MRLLFQIKKKEKLKIIFMRHMKYRYITYSSQLSITTLNKYLHFYLTHTYT